MSDEGDSQPRDPMAVVSGVLTDPAASVEEIPTLLGLLTEDTRRKRLAGALGVCLVGVADPDTVPALVARLEDYHDAEGRAEAKFAHDYLVSQFPERVDAARRDADQPAVGDEQSEFVDAPPADSDAVGRVRPPGGGSFDPRSVEPDREVIDPADPQRHSEEERLSTDAGGRPDGTGPGEETQRRAGATGPAERQRWNQLFNRLSAIVEHSRFDDLMVLSGRKRDRYAEVARVLADDRGVERALELRLFHRPDDGGGSFTENLTDALDQWQAIGDHPSVVELFHWGQQPRPWAATEPQDGTLAERSTPVDPPAALSMIGDLADALAYAHGRGVVHGGIDPENVATPVTDGATPATAALDNVGLLNVYRWYVTPATCLDPRYAAPEYYDRRFGRVDHATDIYQLGAVLYRLVTGRPPFRGEFEQIRADVMNAPPPEPSDVTDVPAALDEIVTKAMGKRTLNRYETINDFHGEVQRVHEELTNAE